MSPESPFCGIWNPEGTRTCEEPPGHEAPHYDGFVTWFGDPHRERPDLGAAEKARDKAIDNVERGREDFIASAIKAISDLREMRGPTGEFTTDALWTLLERRGIEVPEEPRVLGAVMRKVGLLGIAEATSVTQKSSRATCHARPVRVWRFLGENE